MWTLPSILRCRQDRNYVEAQDSFSGKWRPIMDDYWDSCVIPVKWRLRSS